MITSQAQLDASNKWKRKNKERVAYVRLRQAARAFVNTRPGTKSQACIDANFEEYIKDLKKLNDQITKQLKKFENSSN